MTVYKLTLQIKLNLDTIILYCTKKIKLSVPANDERIKNTFLYKFSRKLINSTFFKIICPGFHVNCCKFFYLNIMLIHHQLSNYYIKLKLHKLIDVNFLKMLQCWIQPELVIVSLFKN